MASHELGDSINGLERADFVVDSHDGHEADARTFSGLSELGLRTEHISELIEIDSTKRIDTHHTTTEVLDRIEHGMVLDGAAHHEAGLSATRFSGRRTRCAEHRQVVGFGATARVDDVTGIGAEEFSEFVAGFVDGPTGITGPSMSTRGIGEPIGEEWKHRLDRFGSHRPGGRMVEVGTHPAKGTGAGAHRPLRC
ncbi:unannotated protein [freshwater metagenome]|uniref:Unannotated protein n=1 Tax=freshwater metagenome TaxID=449393 RepID=A0A6J5YGB4_9ZZZZ